MVGGGDSEEQDKKGFVAWEGTDSRAALRGVFFPSRPEQQPWLHTIRVFKEQQGTLSLHKLISSTMTLLCTCSSKMSFPGRVNFTQPLHYYNLACPQEEEEETYGQESFCPLKRVQKNSLIVGCFPVL